MYQRDSKGILKPRERVKKEWAEIPASVHQNLIENIPESVEAMLRVKHGHAQYYYYAF